MPQKTAVRPCARTSGTALCTSGARPARSRNGAVDAVRRRFSALQTDLVFFDGPGGTQVPDEVIEAVSAYYRESNANVSGPYETSRRTEALVTKARLTAADFLGCSAEETIFGAN